MVRFINKGEAVQVREQEGPNRFKWTLLKTGETIDLLRDIGFNYGFEEVKDVEATTGNIGDTKVETKQIAAPEKAVQTEPEYIPNDLFLKELNSIKGIGKKTAKDIFKVFPGVEKLIEAIAAEGHLPFRDDISEKLKRKFLKKEEVYN